MNIGPIFIGYNVVDTRNERQRRGLRVVKHVREMNICVFYNGKYKRHVDN